MPLIIMLVAMVALPAIVAPLVEKVLPGHGALVSLSTTVAEALVFFVTLFLIVKTSKLALADIGLAKKGALRNVVIGTCAGVVTLGMVAVATAMLGGVEITNVFKPEYLVSATGLLVGVVFFALQGTFEELIFRAYLMPHFAKKMGVFWAIAISTLLFTLIHVLNPGITIMPVINLLIASIIFSLIYYIWGNLWLAGLVHGAWNYSQGFILGSLVSGLHLGQTVFVSNPVAGKELLSGGNYGFEGGIITTIVGVVLVIILGSIAKKKAATTTIKLAKSSKVKAA